MRSGPDPLQHPLRLPVASSGVTVGLAGSNKHQDQAPGNCERPQPDHPVPDVHWTQNMIEPPVERRRRRRRRKFVLHRDLLLSDVSNV